MTQKRASFLLNLRWGGRGCERRYATKGDGSTAGSEAPVGVFRALLNGHLIESLVQQQSATSFIVTVRHCQTTCRRARCPPVIWTSLGPCNIMVRRLAYWISRVRPTSPPISPLRTSRQAIAARFGPSTRGPVGQWPKARLGNPYWSGSTTRRNGKATPSWHPP